MSVDRRRFLETCVAAGALTLWPRRVGALGGGHGVRIVRLRHRGDASRYPEAAGVLAREVGVRTSVDIAPETVSLDASHPRMAYSPLAVLGGAGEVRLASAARVDLRRWLEMGGLLLLDNQGKDALSGAFDRSVRYEMEATLAGRRFERISPEHVLYRAFYRLDYAAGRVIRRPYLEGIRMGRRYGVVLCHNDLFGAFARNAAGRFSQTPTPGGENQREMAFRFGVNAVLYALCLHYKDDQVHLDYLLHRRKWKIQRPD